MDRGRRSPSGLPPSTGSAPATTRLKGSRSPAPPKIDVVRRKPVPPAASASPATARLPPTLPPISSGDFTVPVGEDSSQDPISVLPQPPSIPGSPPALIARDLDQYPRGTQTPRIAHYPQNGKHLPANTDSIPPPSRPLRTRQASLNDTSKAKKVPTNEGMQRSASLHPTSRPPINDQRSDDEPSDPAIITKTPRSPGPNKLTSFFGWKTSSPIAEVSPTIFSDNSHSPAPSPRSLSSSARSLSLPQTIDVPKTSLNMGNSYIADTGFPVPPIAGPETTFTEMEEELREISSELAGSIRREMELEDLVDRLQLEASQGPELGRRTSDYFSDSGSGSYRYPLSDAGGSKGEDVAKQKRISEQEKAQFKLSLTQRLQDERDQRKVLEKHVRQLEEQVQRMDKERAISSGVASRTHELESSLEDYRRRLKEEKRGKENFEDLLTALRGEISQFRDERDNLRDEIVPQLRARVEGLEGEAGEYQKLTYENARMQQELQSLKNENTTLVNARRLQLEMQQQPTRFGSIAEEDGLEPSPTTPGLGPGLTRSTSVARGSGQGGLARTGSLKRSNSISSKERESRESLADRVKDIEMQRDALHQALKSLLDRQNHQNREHEKKLRNLEIERDQALDNRSPRKIGYEKEVTGLRHEINQLRRRADDASMQKYHIEKGLGGLKKDLDRAEQETSSLRKVLQEHDILIPEFPEQPTQEGGIGAHATSASLEKAYRDLQATQAMSINKLRELRGTTISSAEDANTEATMELLLKSMNDAEAERDYAKKQAAIFRAQAESLKEAESYHSSENAGLIDQLHASANRVETLSTQVRLQLESNAGLRQRLAEAVGRGEEEQQNSTTRINGMQGKLKALEDKLMSAQQQSEEAFAQHEDEVRDIKESHNMQLQRLKGGLRTPTLFSSTRTTPLSPVFERKLPRLDKTTSGIGMSLDEALRTEMLERKVAELEKALGEADREMEEVVGRMNLAQIEVMELQSARDEAMRQTRKLQVAINAEREKVDNLMK